MVALFGVQRAIAAGGDGGAAQVIADEAIHRAAPLPHRHPLTAGVVVFDHRAGTAGPHEVGADVVGGHTVQHGFDAVAVT